MWVWVWVQVCVWCGCGFGSKGECDVLDGRTCACAPFHPPIQPLTHTHTHTHTRTRPPTDNCAGLIKKDQSLVPQDVSTEDKVKIKGTVVGPGCTIGTKSQVCPWLWSDLAAPNHVYI